MSIVVGGASAVEGDTIIILVVGGAKLTFIPVGNNDLVWEFRTEDKLKLKAKPSSLSAINCEKWVWN